MTQLKKGEHPSVSEDMSPSANILDEAVIDRDVDMARSAIRAQKTKLAVAKLVLEATFHMDRVSDDRDWEHLLESL